MAEATPIHELPEQIRSMAHAYCNGNADQAMAVLMRVYEKRSTRSVAAVTGVPETTVRRLARGFREVCRSWHDRRPPKEEKRVRSKSPASAELV